MTASRAVATVNASVLRLPSPTMPVNMIALQEAKAFTAIENIFTTEDELYKAVSDLIQEERADAATKEVLRYREALWDGFAKMKEKQKIDQDVVLGGGSAQSKIQMPVFGHRHPKRSSSAETVNLDPARRCTLHQEGKKCSKT
ncbi:Fic/DOC family N-terminal domain-containing protein [Algoriphagus oliviformis]|uniref:Fic/DOC family N-terminal domain-containing protein n=1 Tax=Algoriphagus oliviformis TaxID=2811231 RepID=UPI00293D97B9|nr:Fic/DOC family N-terminal domain-containing protein [Algoriphagus oliviformis]